MRYFLTKVIPPALLVNVAINVLAGRAVYPAGVPVPLLGDKSAGGDTLVGAFLIGFFTLLVVRPGARLEARAGRVRGFGGRGAFASWPRRHPFLAALSFGFLWVLLTGAPTVIVLAHVRSEPLPRETFIVFKAAFAGIAGVLAAVVAALAGLWPEPDVSHDPRWSREAPQGVSYPLDFVDKGGLAVTSREHGCSGTPIWQLLVEGALDPSHLRVALADLAVRYPSLSTRVQALDGVPPLARRYRYAQDPRFQPDDLLTVVDLRNDPTRLPTLEAELHDRHLELFTDFPVTLTLAITGDASSRLFFRQHHAIADGRAFIGLLVDFADYLDAARAGRRPASDALEPIGRRSELDALGLPRGRRIRWTLAGYGLLIRALVRGLVRPSKPLLQNRSNDYTGANGVVHWHLEEGVLADWDRARKQAGVSLNSLLAAALFDANRRWHQQHGLTLRRVTGSMLLETRPRDASFRSFANHLGLLEVDLRLDRLTGSTALARAIHAQVKRQRAASSSEKRLLCERQLVSGMTVEQMQGFVFRSKHPAHNLNFSNLIPLEFPLLGGDGWRVAEVRICTPVTPRTGIALTAIRYGGRLCFNFNYKASAISRNEVEKLRRCFEESLAAIG